MSYPPSYRADSPEVRLLLAAAAWPQGEPDRALVREIWRGGLDGPRFLHLVAHHRLVPLVSHNLRGALPGEAGPVLKQLETEAGENTLRALRSLAELRRLMQELAASGVPVRVLKGIPLAQEVFGDLGLRAAGDLDLLVAEESVLEADRVLRGAGYRGLFALDRFSPRQSAFYRTHWKDVAYSRPETGGEVDLHWRCFRNREMPGGDLCAAGAAETVSFGGFQVTTLPQAETLLYLCVHGTLDGWVFLKSLADVGALVRAMPAESLDGLAEKARSYAVLPELSAALWLVRRYFGMEYWSSALLTDDEATVAHILRFTRKALETRGFLAGREAISTRAMVGFEMGLRRSMAYRWELLVRILFRARMWETIPLPDWLFGLYPLLSPFEWIAFRVRQRRTRASE